MRKKISFFILFVLILAGIFLYGLINSSFFLNFALQKSVESALPQARVLHFSYKNYLPGFPRQLTLEDANLIIQMDDQKQVYQCRKVKIINLSGLFQTEKRVKVVFEGLQTDVYSFKMKNLNMDLTANIIKNKLINIQGQLHAQSLDYDTYHIGNITAVIEGDDRKVSLKDIKAEGYGGWVTGQIVLDYTSHLAYIIQLELLGMDLKTMQPANPTVFSQVEGI